MQTSLLNLSRNYFDHCRKAQLIFVEIVLLLNCLYLVDTLSNWGFYFIDFIGNKIEDETHLLLDYQRYSSMKDIFLSKVETKIDDIRKFDTTTDKF